MNRRHWCAPVRICLLLLWTCSTLASTQVVTVRGHVSVVGSKKSSRQALPGTVVWLTPLPGANDPLLPPLTAHGPIQLVQKNKSFEPHVLVVPAGASVEFPNRDPFFHNVFSLFEGKRFDLGLYEAGTSRIVKFERPGISYIFCNIHPEMSAVVITLSTPLYAIATPDGQLTIPNVPFGRYMLHIWSEGMVPESKEPEQREVTISENSSSLGAIAVPAASRLSMVHKNKYGREYDAPTPDSSIYKQQP